MLPCERDSIFSWYGSTTSLNRIYLDFTCSVSTRSIYLLHIFIDNAKGFLDRVNIGQARLAGLEKDLKLHGNQVRKYALPSVYILNAQADDQYDIALTIFFVSYVA